MYGKEPSLRKSFNFETSATCRNHQSRGCDDGLHKEKCNKENSLRFKIPMSYVVSSAQSLCSEARCIQQLDLVQRSCKIDEFCKDILHKNKKFAVDETQSSGKHVWTPNYRRITDGCSALHEESIKRARKQEFESAKKRTLTAKRRPLSTSNKQVWFLNKDTTSAILSSKNIAEQFTNIHKKSTRSLQQNLKKPRTKSALIDKVPKFTTVPSEYHELCRNKSVNEIMDFSLHGKGYGELDEGKRNGHRRRSSSVTTPRNEKHLSKEWKNRNDIKIKSMNPDTKRKEYYKTTQYSQFSNSKALHSKYDMPKNIYIRKNSTGSETMEDLVEVRNQEELDILNTIATLQLLDSSNKHENTSGKYFEDLLDYEVYCYPC